MRSRFGIILGTRRLREEGDHGKEIVVELGMPRKMKGGDWECPFRIRGLGTPKIEYGHGIDGIQALLQAVEGIRVKLEQSNRQFTLDGAEPGDTGFRRIVPAFFGLKFSKRLERLIEIEIRRFARVAEGRYRRRQKDKEE